MVWLIEGGVKVIYFIKKLSIMLTDKDNSEALLGKRTSKDDPSPASINENIRESGIKESKNKS